MEHERIEEMIAAYAVGGLDPAERAAAERDLIEHLPGCGSCQALYRDLREVAADLALAVPPGAVPPDLEQRILARVRGEPQPRPAARRLSTRVAGVAAAVMLVAVGGLGAWNATIAGRLDRAERRAAEVTEALAMLGDPQVRTASLAGPGGSLVLAYRPGGRGVLVGTGVGSPGAGRVFELWLVKGSVPTPVAVFRPSDGVVVVPVGIDPSGFERVAVTIERGRVDRPTGSPVYSAQLSA